MPAELSPNVAALLEGSPLSPACQQAYADIFAWDTRKGRLEDRAKELHLLRAEAVDKYHVLLARFPEFTRDGLAQAKEESGLTALDEEIGAIDTILPRLPAERARAAEEFERVRTRERRENLARLAGEQRALVKKCVSVLRQLRPLLPEMARISVEAARWAREAKAPRPSYEGHTFPAWPPSALAELVRHIVAVHGHELEDGR